MPQLRLAIDIADAVSAAAREQRRLDPAALARDLLRAHPEAEATQDEILAVLVVESVAAGSPLA